MTIDTFRLATINDVEALVALVNNAYHPPINPHSWTDETRFVSGTRTDSQAVSQLLRKDQSIILLGIAHHTLVACVHLEHSANQVQLGMLAVTPPLQNVGLGKQMLEQAEAYAVRYFKPEKIVLIVIALRTELIAFYLRRGYQNTGATIAYATLCGATCDATIAGLEFAVLEKYL